MITGKTIFISPLDWGLGHATRCVPLVKQFVQNNKVIIGVTQNNLTFFEDLFPEIQKIELPSYRISYSAFLPVWLKVLMQWPRINLAIKREKKLLEKIIAEEKIDIVISDNRFGLYHKNVRSIFVTHQLKLKTPFKSKIANRLNKKYIHRFNEVWVPDYEAKAERLSGELSDSNGIKLPVKYIGPLSVFQKPEPESDTFIYDILILLSGTEPQRSILEKLLLKKVESTNKKVVLVRGKRKAEKIETKGVEVIDFCHNYELKKLILHSETIICRSGYSTLMDLHVLGKKNIILIPTPGQTEQEYLAEYWKEKYKIRVIPQKNILREIL